MQVYARPSFYQRYYADIRRKWAIYQLWESHEVLLERSVIITYESTTNKSSNCIPDAPTLNVASQSGNIACKITSDALARFEQIINMLSEIGLYAVFTKISEANLPIGWVQGRGSNANQDLVLIELGERVLLDSNLALFNDYESIVGRRKRHDC